MLIREAIHRLRVVFRAALRAWREDKRASLEHRRRLVHLEETKKRQDVEALCLSMYGSTLTDASTCPPGLPREIWEKMPAAEREKFVRALRECATYVHPEPPTPPPGYALPEMYDGWTLDGRCVLVFVMPGPVSHKITIEPAPPLGPVEGYNGCVLFASNGGVHYTGGHRSTGSLRQIIHSVSSAGILGPTCIATPAEEVAE